MKRNFQSDGDPHEKWKTDATAGCRQWQDPQQQDPQEQEQGKMTQTATSTLRKQKRAK